MNETTPNPKRYYRVATLLVATALVFTAGTAAVVALWWDGRVDVRRREVCAEKVADRADNRAMWDFLIGMSPPEPDNEVGQEFVKYLDERLPHLECVGDSPTPVPVEDQ